VGQPGDQSRASESQDAPEASGQPGRQCESQPAHGHQRPEPDARAGLAAEEIGQAQGHEVLLGEHRHDPECLGHEQTAQHPAGSQETQPARDHPGGRTHGRQNLRAAIVGGRAGPPGGGTRLGHEADDHRQIDRLADDEQHDGQVERGRVPERMPGDEPPAQQRTGGDADPQQRMRTRQCRSHRTSRLDRAHGVDEPCLQRARVERPEDTHERRGEHERSEIVREQVGEAAEDAESARHHQHGLSSQRVGESGGRQLQEKDDRSLDRRVDADLGDGEPSLGRQQGVYTRNQSDREPAREGEGPEDTLDVPDARHGFSPTRRRARGSRRHPVGERPGRTVRLRSGRRFWSPRDRPDRHAGSARAVPRTRR